MLIRFALSVFVAGVLTGAGIEPVKADCDLISARVTVGAGTIHYDRAGSGPSVVLLHGLFAQKEQWRSVLCDLAADGFDAIAPDLPGFGQSKEYPVTVYDLNTQVELLDRLVEALDIEEFSLSGNSMGGAIAALYTGRHPGKVRRLAFIGSPLGLVPWGPKVRQAILQGVNPFIPLDDIQFEQEMRLLFARPPDVADEIRDSLIHDYVTRNLHYQQVWSIINLFDTVLQDIPREPRLGEMQVLILWGESDSIYPVDGAEYLHGCLPNSRLVTLPETGHLPMIESAAETSKHLIRFLQESPGREVQSGQDKMHLQSEPGPDSAIHLH